MGCVMNMVSACIKYLTEVTMYLSKLRQMGEGSFSSQLEGMLCHGKGDMVTGV